MKTHLILAASAIAITTLYAQPQAASSAALATDYGKLPLSFEANQGQTDQQVKFLSRGPGYSLFLTDTAAVLALTKEEPDSGKASLNRLYTGQSTSPKPVEVDVIRMELAGASRFQKVSGMKQLPGSVNYFVGRNQAMWHNGVPTYAKVKYSGVYPGVDLVYYGNQRQLEYDFVVAPGASAKPVRLHFSGSDGLKLKRGGDLDVLVHDREIRLHKPEVYQMLHGKRMAVDGNFVLLANNSVSFRLGRYDHSRELVIDPTLAYSTFLSGSIGSQVTGIAVDKQGSAYLTGQALSADFPVTGSAFQKEYLPEKNTGHGTTLFFVTFVTKLNPAGSALIYSTFLGGSNAKAIALDEQGNAYVTGLAGPTNFPVTSGAFQATDKCGTTVPCSTGFVTKLNAAGSALVYSTYLGGSGYQASDGSHVTLGDSPAAIAVDACGEAYITGSTSSIDFPLSKDAFQTANRTSTYPRAVGFVTKVSASGSDLVYSTYLGGSQGGDFGTGVAVDSSGFAYVTGGTASTDFPTIAGGFQTIKPISATTAFVTKLNREGTGLVYSTFLGGSNAPLNDGNPGGDVGYGIAVDSTSHAYVTGLAGSTNFPTTGSAFQTVNRAAETLATNAFVTKLNYAGSELIYSTYLGGSGWSQNSDGFQNGGDSAAAIALDSQDHAFVIGSSASRNFPVTANAFQKINKSPSLAGPVQINNNAFLAELNNAGTALIYSTYLGGSGQIYGDSGYSIAVDQLKNPYLVGIAYSPDFPVTGGAFQTTLTPTVGLPTAFITKIALHGATTTVATTTAASQTEGKLVTFTALVTANGKPNVPAGIASFNVDGRILAHVQLDGRGLASFSTTNLTIGQHRVIVSYLGDPVSYSASSTNLVQSIVAATP